MSHNFILNNNNCLNNEKNDDMALCCFSHKFDKFVKIP